MIMAKKKRSLKFSLVNPQAAGIDIGSRSNWVCAGENQIKEFGVFTESHHSLAQWLKEKQVKTIAMESTGIYWKPLFLILQAYGFETILVNAAHIKNVRGKKTDVDDCHWIWQLHSAGLLHASFQPDSFTEEIRTYNRQRKNLIDGASRYISKMQKALILMNLQLPIVLSDITGKSGKAIISSILAGERDGLKLAQLADPRVRADKSTIAKALTGQWHPQHLFTLRQSWDMYHFHHKQIQECDTKIDTLLKKKIEEEHLQDLFYETKKKPTYKNAPSIEIAKYAFQLSEGVDLIQVDGISTTTIMSIISEVGFDLEEKFPTAKHFVSWMCLCPNRKISGGKILSSRSQKNKNRLAYAFRQAANTVGNQKNTTLSHFFRRIAYRKGRKVAITATARKLAIIVYNMITKKQNYEPQGLVDYQEQVRIHNIRKIQKTIKRLQISSKELSLQ